MILRDAVHGLVSFESPAERIVPRLMDTAEAQRLRRIRQLGLTSLAFPGAEHTRFAHAIGAAHIMTLLLARLRSIDHTLPTSQRITEDAARDALAAAFVHDLGHGPYSHLFEDVFESIPHHEVWTERILLDESTEIHRALTAVDRAMPARVAALVRGEHELRYLASSVSGAFDVDRCDYLLRDAHATGVRYGLFDLDFLLRSMRFSPSSCGAPSLAIDGAKGLPAIEAFVLARVFMFQQVYLHKATRAAEWMVRAILARAAQLIRDGSPPPQVPQAIVDGARGDSVALGDYLALDDALLSATFHTWEGGRDPILRDLCARVRNRHLFKTLELFGDQASAEGGRAALELAREIARSRGVDPDWYVGLDATGQSPFDSQTDPLLVVYSKGPARELTDVSFLLARLANQTISRTRLIFVAELREEITRALSSGAPP